MMIVYLLYVPQGERGAQGPQGFKVTCCRCSTCTETWALISSANKLRLQSPFWVLVCVALHSVCNSNQNILGLYGVYRLLIKAIFIVEKILSLTYSNSWARQLPYNMPEIIDIHFCERFLWAVVKNLNLKVMFFLFCCPASPISFSSYFGTIIGKHRTARTKGRSRTRGEALYLSPVCCTNYSKSYRDV